MFETWPPVYSYYHFLKIFPIENLHLKDFTLENRTYNCSYGRSKFTCTLGYGILTLC